MANSTETTSDDSPAASDRLPTNLRLLLILEAVARAGRPLTPTEINRDVGLPKQSMHRLCQTLVREGFLRHDADQHGLVAAPRLRAMAAALARASDLEVARRQVLEDVARRVGETVNFVVPEAGGMSYLDRVETRWPFRIQLPIGSNVPFHCTASGKTWLASLPTRRRTALVRGLPLEQHTERTLISAATLLAELEEILARGHAFDNEEFMTGMVAIAVPVTSDDGTFIAALAFHGPVQRLTPDTLKSHLPTLLHAAERLRDLYAE